MYKYIQCKYSLLQVNKNNLYKSLQVVLFNDNFSLLSFIPKLELSNMLVYVLKAIKMAMNNICV